MHVVSFQIQQYGRNSVLKSNVRSSLYLIFLLFTSCTYFCMITCSTHQMQW